MKKLIYIIALFVSTFAFSQISGKLIPDGSIPSAKIIGGVGSGESNPNIFIATLASDFISPNVANANKVWEVRTAINTGASNIDFSSVAGVTISFKGGSLTGTGTITPNKTSIIGDFNDANYIANTYTLLSGTWKGNINANWFGLVGDNTTNNRLALLNAAKFVNNSGGTCYVYNDSYGGIYAFSVVARPPFNSDYPANIVLTGTAKWEGVMDKKRPSFKMMGHNFSNTEMFSTHYLTDGHFKNIELIGDRYEHTPSAGGAVDEGVHNFVVGTKTLNFTFENNVTKFSNADGLGYENHYEFYNKHRTTAYTQGNINPTTGDIVSDVGFMYSNALFPVSNSDFTLVGKFMLIGDSYGTSIQPRIFKAAYYTSADVLIGVSEFLTWYDENIIPENCAKVRIIIPYSTVDEELHVACSFLSDNTYILHNKFEFNKRQGISNPERNFKIMYNVFETTSPTSPARHIDIEDLYQGNRNGEIAYNTFRDARNGDIVSKASEFINFHNNLLDSNSKYAFSDGQALTTNGTGIQLALAFNSKVDNNILKNRSLSIGKGSSAIGNVLYGGILSINNEYSKVIGGEYYNTQIRVNNLAYTNGNSIIKDATFIYNIPLQRNAFDTKGDLVLENVLFDFKNTNVSGAGGQPIANPTALVIDGSRPVYGYWHNVRMINIGVPDANKWTTSLVWFAQPFANVEIDMPLRISNGKQVDIKWKDIKIKGRLELELLQFTDGGTITDWEIDGFELNADNILYEQYTASILMTKKKDINLSIKNGKIRYATGIRDLFTFLHNGTTYFENVDFYSPDTFSKTATGITFKNCTFNKGGGTITMTGATIE